jgi:thiamine-phosphate pyrophosphorylase
MLKYSKEEQRLNVDKKSMLLYAVTDRTWLGDKKLEDEVEKVLKAGATFIQLREKNVSFDEFLQVAKKVKAVTDKYKVPFVINDNVEIAKEIDADGVHIGQSDMEAKRARSILGNGKIMGISAGSVEEAVTAEKNGADYIGVGAVFHTNTKKDATDMPMDVLKDITKSVHIPVVAIGGISKENIMKLKGTGVDGVAVISAIFAQKDAYTAAKELKALSEKMVKA